MSEIKCAFRCRPFTIDDQLGVILTQNSEEEGEVALINSDYTKNRFAFSYSWWSAYGFERHLKDPPPQAAEMQLIDQSAVYEGCGQKVKAELMNGDAVVLFAYGLSGSGKTFTVFGPDAVDIPEAWFKHSQPHALWGIFPRLAYDLFQMQQEGWKISMKYFQNVVDTVRDLMSAEAAERSFKDGMRKDADGFMDIEWCTSVVLNSWDHLRQTFMEANTRKAISPTQFNHQSTRGHCIMTLEIEMPDPKDPVRKQISRLYICDLAGTEPAGDIVYAKYKKKEFPDGTIEHQYIGPHPNQKKTKDLQDQGKKINLSLSEMAQFFMKMAAAVKRKRLKPGRSIPGCNSYFLCKYLKDTILQAKTYLFCAIRPEVTYHRYTYATLGFAANASVVKLAPKRATVSSSPAERKLKGELEEIKAQLVALERQNAQLKEAAKSSPGEQGTASATEIEAVNAQIRSQQEKLKEMADQAEASKREKEKEDQRQRDEYAKHGLSLVALEGPVNTPHFINLDEDPFRNQRFRYNLKPEGVTTIGPGGDVQPLDFGAVRNHCAVQVEGARVLLRNGVGETYHNGLPLSENQQVELQCFDRIAIASELMMFIQPGEEMEKVALSAEAAFEELHTAIRTNESEKQKQYAEKLKSFEADRKRWEEQTLKAHKSAISEAQEDVAQSEKLAQALVDVNNEMLELMPAVEACEEKCRLLGRPMLELSVAMDLPLPGSTDLPKAKVEVLNKDTQEKIFLETSVFEKNHTLLNEEVIKLRQALENGREYTSPEAHDPITLLFDNLAEIGSAVLECQDLLFYRKTEQVVDIKELSPTGADIGDLEAKWTPLNYNPWDDEGQGSIADAAEGVLEVLAPQEMVGKPWTYQFEILNAASLPILVDLAFCQYRFNGQLYQTETVQQDTSSPTFNYRFIHHVDTVTLEFLEELKKPMEITLFVSPKVVAPEDKISTRNKQIQANVFPEGVLHKHQSALKDVEAENKELQRKVKMLEEKNQRLEQEVESLKSSATRVATTANETKLGAVEEHQSSNILAQENERLKSILAEVKCLVSDVHMDKNKNENDKPKGSLFGCFHRKVKPQDT